MQKDIIHFLKNAENYISGEEISQSLKISRTAIWKYIQNLRYRGYEIVAVPHLGYKLVSSPDKLFPHEIQHELKTKILGKKIIYDEVISSTMDVAVNLAMSGQPDGTVVICEAQTKGRGRLGRQWTSPKDKGIYMSIILKPKLPPSEVAKLTLLSAISVTDAIRNTSNLDVVIKWPNDILFGHKKIAGILTEMNAEVDRVKFVVVGIGINVNTALTALPAQATSLKQETKKEHSRVKLVQEILKEIEKWYSRLAQDGFSPVVKRWKELSMTLNHRVKVSDPAGVVEGEAIDLDQDGGLLIRKDSGVIVKKMAGDVVLAH